MAAVHDAMWAFLMKGGQKGNPEQLEEAVNLLVNMMKQKNAGQKKYARRDDIPFDLANAVVMSVVCEAVALVLDNRYDKITELFKDE